MGGFVKLESRVWQGAGGRQSEQRGERKESSSGGSRQAKKEGSGTGEFTSLPLPTLFH